MRQYIHAFEKRAPFRVSYSDEGNLLYIYVDYEDFYEVPLWSTLLALKGALGLGGFPYERMAHVITYIRGETLKCTCWSSLVTLKSSPFQQWHTFVDDKSAREQLIASMSS